MDHQEQFFKDQIRIIHDSRNEKEEDFERIQQEERQKVKQSSMERRLKYGIVIPSDHVFMTLKKNSFLRARAHMYRNIDGKYL